MTYSLSEIAEIISGRLIGKDTGIRYFSIDSRTLSGPEGVLFIALKGERHDAHRYIGDLIRRGVKAFLVSDRNFIHPQASFILVEDSLIAFQKLAAYHRRKYAPLLVGITGSNGKTIVKEWIYQALRKDRPVFRSPRSYNSQVGVPLSVLMIEDIFDLAVIEAGISMPGEMEKLEKIISPDIGIITNIGEAHQENFSSREHKLKEKLILFRNAGTIIYCRDDQLIHKKIKELYPEGKKLLSWGRDPESDFRITAVQGNNQGTRVEVEGNIAFNFQIPFQDKASLENALHLMLLLNELEYSVGFISNALLNLEPVAMRLEVLKGINSCTLISDTCNSDIVSLSNALDLLLRQDQHSSRTLILSDILQSGRNEKELYSDVARLISEKSVNRIVGIGQALSGNSDLFPENSVFFKNTEDFINSSLRQDFKNEAILIKGARKFDFDKITRHLQLRTHQTVLEVDMNAVIHNLNYYRSLLKPSTKIMAMVKAFSYGSGSYEIASLLQFHKVDYLAVAFTDEGFDLRLNGIRLPVMVMNPESGNFKILVENHLEPEIYSFEVLKEFINYLESNEISNYPVHVKIDSGMHRLGFLPSEMEELAKQLKSTAVKVESVFSHLAASDEPEHDDFTLQQISLFTETGNRLRKLLGTDFIMHILNSSGIERFPSAQMDMVRLGIGLYGVSTVAADKLTEASTFRTNISQIRELNEKDTVGYGRKGLIHGRMVIATLPVGYADGIPRVLGNGKGRFLVRNKMVPTIGNICMDMCMIDITGTDARLGDDVIIFGSKHPVSSMAADAGTIPYEILSRISERVKRIYYHE